MKRIHGKTLVEFGALALDEMAKGYQSVLLDVGTGDGKFVIKKARELSHVLCIGLEPAWERLIAVSNKALRRVEKGGAPNALFLCASAESPIPELEGRIDLLSANYPWGSLLSGLCVVRDEIVGNLTRFCKSGARFTINFNTAVFEDPVERIKLALPEVNLGYCDNILRSGFQRFGWKMTKSELLRSELPVETSWGAQLVKGSGRNTLQIELVLEK